MLKFTAVQLVNNEDMKDMILVIHQTKILQCYELYTNIECNTVSIPNPKLVPYQPQYYPQSHYLQLFDATQDTLSLSQQEQNIFEPNASSFTQLLFAPFFTKFFYPQPFNATKDHLHSYFSTSAV